MTILESSDANRRIYCILILLTSVFVMTALVTCMSCSGSRPAKSVEPVQADAPKQEHPEKKAPEADKETPLAETRVFNMSEVSEPPEIIKSHPPHYPDMARLMGVEGKVILRLLIDEEGDVIDVKVLRTIASDFRSGFERASIKAAKQYKYKPAILDGKPVPCWAKVTIKYKLN